MGVYWSIQPAPARPEGIYPRTRAGPLSKLQPYQRKSVPSPLVVADLIARLTYILVYRAMAKL